MPRLAPLGDCRAEVVSLYHGEVVAVSGDYMGSTSLAGYPTMPILRNCRVAGPQHNVVRPAEAHKLKRQGYAPDITKELLGLLLCVDVDGVLIS